MANAYAFNPDRSKAPVYTKEEVNQISQALSLETNNRIASDTALGRRIDNIVATAGDGTIPSELSDIRTLYNGFVNTTASVSTKETQKKLEKVKKGFHRLMANDEKCLSAFRYQSNCFFANDVLTYINDFDTFYVPVSENDIIIIIWDDPNDWVAPNFNTNRCYCYETSDGVLHQGGLADPYWNCVGSANNHQAVFVAPEDCVGVYFTFYAPVIERLRIFNSAFPVDRNMVATEDSDIFFKSHYCFRKQPNSTNPFDWLLLGDQTNYWGNFIPVKQGDVIKFKSSVVTGFSHLGTFVPKSNLEGVKITTTEFTVPEDGVVCGYNYQQNNMIFIPKADSGIKWDQVIDPPSIIDEEILFGKTWVSFGDSITYRESWQPYVVAKCGGTHVNKGIGSTALSGNSSGAFWTDARLNAVKAANPDIVTILGGANDIGMNPNIGDESNLVDKDTGTFIGAYSYIIDNLKTWKPSLEIIILGTTWAHNNGTDVSQTLTYKDFSDACELVADYYQLPFVDLWSNSGFNKYTMNNSPYNIYSNDHIHPNNAGGKIIAAQVIAKMREIYGVN